MRSSDALSWGAYVTFVACALYVSIGKIAELHWGRQIGADLYLGLCLALFIVYLHEGAVAALLWALPTLAFANLSILLYVAIHFDALVARFLA
jgi:hypothetical protein